MWHVIKEIKDLIARAEATPEGQAVLAVEHKAVAEAEALGSSAWAYVKANGLQDLVGIAKAALLGAATGTPYAAILATVVKDGEAAGISIAKGAEAIVVAGAQADLIAAGKLVSPATTELVAAPVAAS